MEAAAPAPALETRDLGRRFGRRWALAHVDLEVPAGGSLLLAGANGSGKTTLLRLVSGRLESSAGTLRVFGLDPRRQRGTVRSGLSLVAHHLSLYPRLTAAETLALWLRLGGEEASRARVGELWVEAGLEEHGDVEVGGFSAGMRKRLALVRVRIETPRLLLLDEPFSALDAAGRAWLAQWLAGLHREGVGLVIASHALEWAAPLCQRAVRLTAGQVTWRGPAADLLVEGRAR
ncbi:MAG: ABC transporter ATP-binding protein [Thermoanaerobaculia bacterium]